MPKVGPYNLKNSEVITLDEAYTAVFVELQKLRGGLYQLATLAASGDYFYRTNQSDFPFQPFGRTEGFLFVYLWLVDPNRMGKNPAPLIVYVSSHAGGPTEYTFNFPILLDLAAEFNSRTLSQTKSRISGVWKGGGIKNPMRIRVPHR